MKVETIINGSTKIIIIPETTLEEEILKVIGSQKNEIVEARNGFAVGNVTHTRALVIQAQSTGNLIDEE
jgi:hypothetical protein